MKYRTKPFEIDAVQWNGKNTAEITDFTEVQFRQLSTDSFEVYDFLQATWVRVNIGDYIIRGMVGEYYPCNKEVFEAKYEPA